MNRRRFLAACAACAALAAGLPAPRARALGPPLAGRLEPRPSPFSAPLPGGAAQCTLCPNACALAEGERGRCRVRENRGGRMHTLAWGNPCAVNADPVEKKPFYHVLPGTRSFSLATAGCNLGCLFCQNWEISQARPEDTLNYDLPPDAAVDMARRSGSASLASTYVEPTIFLEYMLDLGRLCRAAGLLKVMHSNGYVNPAPLDALCDVLDAACIDLKGFTEDYYRDMCGGALAPVLASLRQIRARGVHLELVNLVVPGRNDDLPTIRAMCRWVRDELGPDTPLHFTRFVPQYRLKTLPPTPQASLEAAYAAAREEGLNFVYVGNVPGHPAESTYCPQCKALLIRRVGYATRVEGLRDGRCAACGRQAPGIWAPPSPRG
ncbi:MAG: AmmeMemoRadiSam system radical SAM enzyme [Thermodesulfobacteriota bacterium]